MITIIKYLEQNGILNNKITFLKNKLKEQKKKKKKYSYEI